MKTIIAVIRIMLMLLSLFVSLVMSVVMLTGCHGSGAPVDKFEVPDEFDETQIIEITFWAKNDTNKTQADIYQKAIDEFESLYPNINVTLRLYTDYRKIYNDVITNIATDTTPNVCITYPDHIATYLTGEDIVVPLDDLMADSKYGFGGSELKYDSPTSDEMVTKFMDECIINGNYYALPYMRSSEACYINKDFVEDLGFIIPDVLTWDFIWEVSEAAMAKDAEGNYVVNGQKVMIPFIYKSTDNMMITMLKQLNADYSTNNGDILIFNNDTKDILYTIAEHAGTGAFSTFKISSYPANFLNAGQCIFAIDSTAGATWMGSNAPLSDISEDSLVNFETVVMPVPQYDPENQYMISQGPSICIFNKENSQEVLASWLFAQFLLTNEVQIAYAETEGYIPVTTKAQQSDEYQEYLSLEGIDNNEHYSIKIQASKLILDNINNTYVTPVFNGSASLRDAAGMLIESVTKSMRRKEVVDDEYINNLFEETSSLYRLDSIAGSNMASKELGELPEEAGILIGTLVFAWICIIAYFIYKKVTEGKRYD